MNLNLMNLTVVLNGRDVFEYFCHGFVPRVGDVIEHEKSPKDKISLYTVERVCSIVSSNNRLVRIELYVAEGLKG